LENKILKLMDKQDLLRDKSNENIDKILKSINIDKLMKEPKKVIKDVIIRIIEDNRPLYKSALKNGNELKDEIKRN